jgi:hypothetical protein
LRASLPGSMLLFGIWSAFIRGVKPVGRSKGMNRIVRRNSFRMCCSMASSSQSYGPGPVHPRHLLTEPGMGCRYEP